MVSPPAAYPFVPRSNAYLLPGHIWGIPLRDGRSACGVVVAVPTAEEAPHGAINSRTFVAGLLDWVGDEPPTPAAVDESPLLNWGYGHIKLIGANGGSILGRRSPVHDREGALLAVSHRMGGTVGLYRAGRMLRLATADEARDLPVIGTWGGGFIAAIADRVFVDGKPIVR
ncbi:immunity 26/phosphotriesterase HocA family protein [Kribbella hippodromi]|uniref:Immunity 26/phosphotriesterase HocA family protein n=1 Tax=Kribbella hippodromi TaxID=434347 RepID=A0ABP4PKN6_9ACTN